MVRLCAAESEGVAPAVVARLGLALAELTRALPGMTASDTREYFAMVESLARGALSALMMKERHEC